MRFHIWRNFPHVCFDQNFLVIISVQSYFSYLICHIISHIFLLLIQNRASIFFSSFIKIKKNYINNFFKLKQKFPHCKTFKMLQPFKDCFFKSALKQRNYIFLTILYYSGEVTEIVCTTFIQFMLNLCYDLYSQILLG